VCRLERRFWQAIAVRRERRLAYKHVARMTEMLQECMPRRLYTTHFCIRVVLSQSNASFDLIPV
jgi:hypothetical protein